MYQPFDLTGKVALVTGGNGGIGFGMAEAMAQAGSDIVIWGTREEKNAAAKEKLRAHGRRVSVRKVNVANEAEVVAGVKAALEEMGRIDCAIANAGIGGGAPSFSQMTLETWRRVHAVNEEGLFFTLREVTKHGPERAAADLAGTGLDAWAVANLLAYVEEQREATNAVPHDQQLVGEVQLELGAVA